MNAIVRSTAFSSGDGIAVRLPDASGIVAGAELDLVVRGSEIVIRPVFDSVAEKAKVARLVKRLREIGPVGEIEVREPIEYPERPGL